ncbi:MAG: ATP-binding cassette domain-containing protein [Planctomycetes bacterium]|nr:ATP-binding cassette domain-containing protein [Planctomycetota bacterium]
MPLISLSHVSMHHGGPLLFEDVTLNVEKGAKIGIIGANGTGKSTLLNIMAGVLEPTAGQVTRQRGVRIGFQEQELRYDPDATIIQEMKKVFTPDLARAERLADLEHKLADTQDQDQLDRILKEYEMLRQEHDAAGGYSVERRIESVLSSLGLDSGVWGQKIASFSGGERNIIALARIVLSRPDVILLDEPSNHLDLDGIEWFIRFIRSIDAAVVMVSHDRHLLDATVDTIWELRSRRFTEWTGNYTDFEQAREKALALQERMYKFQQRTIARLQFQARRLMDMANAYDDPGQARRAKIMLRRIEEMEKVEKPTDGKRLFHASLKGAQRHGRIALSIKDFGYTFSGGNGAERTLFDHADLDIEFGERVALVGRNGSGKSTLFKEILTRADWLNPQLRIGKAVKIGDYNQLHAVLDTSSSLIDWCALETGLSYKAAADLLHRFLFSREDLDRPISTLSGGEKSRLQIARLVHAKANLLMLDEPTNHLDIDACEQLEEVLTEYDGTLLIISHDRSFLERLVNRVVEIDQGKLHSFEGTFSEWMKQRPSSGRSRALQMHSQREAGEQRKALAAVEREKIKTRQREERQIQSRLKKIEMEIAKLEADKHAMESEIEVLYSNPSPNENERQKALDLNQSLKDLAARLENLYAQWESNEHALNPRNGT